MENTLYYDDNLDMPPIRQVDKTFKRAQRSQGKGGERLEIKDKT
jgi:hypothetical protein